MNIFISADDKYILPAQVMLTSLLINNPETHTIYFLYRSAKQANIRILEDIVNSYKSHFIPVQITSDNFKNFESAGRFPIETFFRLSISSILPEKEERALWLDVDLIVNASLQDFYNQDFGEKAFVACKDRFISESHIENLDLNSDSIYINAGVILFNMPIFRNFTLDDYYNLFVAHKEILVWLDQDILNCMFTNQIKALDNDNYNVQILDWRHNDYDLNNASIIHYVGPFKPWSKKYTNPAAEIWDKYYALAFNKGNFYILAQKHHRKLEKKFYAPLRRFVLETYNKADLLKNFSRFLKNTLRKH
jgi:lipopolysaccharide biosynthesis glycosyltransferase